MEIPTQRDHVDDEMPRRGRTHIAGSAIVARFGQFEDSPASAGVPCRNGLGYPLAGFCGERVIAQKRPFAGVVDDALRASCSE
jgi:hypothetical protein